jgi:hypothetical protein
MKSLKLTLSLLAILGLSACRSTPTKAPTPKKASSDVMTAALITVPSTGTTRLLSIAVSEALNGSKVNLAADAFTKSSRLNIERNTENPSNKPGLNGRLMGLPVVHRFALMVKARKCYLVYEKTGKKYKLDGVKCRSAS